MAELADIRKTLNPVDRWIWDNYLQFEIDRIRPEALLSLNQLISRLESYEETDRICFVLAVAQFVLAHGIAELPVRQPLFAKIILPVLLSNYDRGEVGSARALRAFSSLLYGGGLHDKAIGARDLSGLALLERAIHQEPDARDLKEQLLYAKEDKFEFATHHIPEFVLYENHVASASECEILLADLNLYEVLAKKLGKLESHKESIKEWRYYISGYREYLSRSDDFASFEHYLNANPIY